MPVSVLIIHDLAGPTWGPRGGGARGREGPGGKWKGIDPVIPFTDAHTLSSMQEFYGFAPGFMLGQQLISRTSTDVVRPKRLYYVSAGMSHFPHGTLEGGRA